MPELRMIAYKIKGYSNEEEMDNIPVDFFKSIAVTNFSELWYPNSDTKTDTNSYKNISNFKQADSSRCDNNTIYHGYFIETNKEDSIKLIDYNEGSEEDHKLPEGKGQRKTWEFTVAPKHNILILENKDRGTENKLTQYLNSYTLIWNKVNEEKKIDTIEIQAVPKEDDPSGWLRKNPNLGSFEAKLNARSIQNRYGLLKSDLFEGLGEQVQDLTIKIEISASKRGKELPEMLVTNLADFLEKVDKDNLYQSNVKPVSAGKRSRRPTKLLDALETKDVYV